MEIIFCLFSNLPIATCEYGAFITSMIERNQIEHKMAIKKIRHYGSVFGQNRNQSHFNWNCDAEQAMRLGNKIKTN